MARGTMFIAEIIFMFLKQNLGAVSWTQTRLPVGSRGVVPATFQSIQALRGVAAVMVGLFHAGLRADPTGVLFGVGNAGVDIFFVISGFVMWTVTARRPTPALLFLRHRIVRLVPMYWIMTLAMIAAYTAMPSAFPRFHLSAGHILQSLAFVPHITDDGLNQPVLGQGWTLNFEVFFYLLFALTLTRRARRFGLIAALLSGLALLNLVVPAEDFALATTCDPLLVEFLAGICLARLVQDGRRPRLAWCWAAVALGVLWLAVLPTPEAGADWTRLLVEGVPAVLIVGGSVGAELGGGLRVGRLPLLLGAASYSIYLTHTFAISLTGKMAAGMRLPPALFMATAMVVAALLGIACYLLLERPLLAVLRDRPRRLQVA